MRVFLHEMTHPEVSRKAEEGAVVIIPLGSMEQHGVHLPLGTDFLIALEISRRVAEKTRSIVAPVLWVGFSKEHMAFKGTITLESETLTMVLRDVIRSLASHGFRKIIVVNAHGGNDAPVRSSVLDANLNSDADVLYVGPDELSSFLPQRLKHELEKSMDLHAGVLETSIINLVRPDLVRRSQPSKPKVKIGKHVLDVLDLAKDKPALRASILSSVLARFDELSDNGALTLSDPLSHWDASETEEALEEVAGKLAKIVEKWKLTGKAEGLKP
ncbi:MAG: creatininase family protein [Candidatus Freyarchaeota archaeon]|nr:creatininase family protein [Candidatus Jordarchaeia archaeon]